MKIVLLTTGYSYSMKWVLSFLGLLQWASENKINISYSFTSGANIYKVRDKAIQGYSTEENPQILNGMQYDYILWVDNDQVFKPDVLINLLKADKDIISALIRVDDGSFSVGRLTGENHSEGVKRLTEIDLLGKKEPFEIDTLGFGFTLIKKGVYESIPYPWHKPEVSDKSYLSEDASLCKRLRDKGYTLWVEPQTIVYHEKRVLL